MKSAAISFFIFFTSAVLVPVSIEAQNLVPNGTFDTDVNGWNVTLPNVTMVWDANDRHGAPDVGSAVITNDFSLTNMRQVVTSSCVTGIVGGQQYDIGAWIEAPTGQGTSGLVSIFAFFYSGPSCASSLGVGFGVTDIAPTDTWTLYNVTNRTAPAGAGSARFEIWNSRSAAVPWEFHVDDTFVGPPGTVPVELLTFEVH